MWPSSFQREDYQYRGADRCEQSSAFLSQEWCKTLRCRFEAGFLELKEQRAEEEKEEELVKREEGGPGHRGEGKRISEHEQEGLRGQPAACTKSPGEKIGEEAHSSNVSSVRMSRRSSSRSQQPGLSFPLACCREGEDGPKVKGPFTVKASYGVQLREPQASNGGLALIVR
jgi:hypothetical protein